MNSSWLADLRDWGHRGGKDDHFSRYAAEGRRSDGARIVSRPLFAGPYSPEYNLQAQVRAHVSVSVFRASKDTIDRLALGLAEGWSNASSSVSHGSQLDCM